MWVMTISSPGPDVAPAEALRHQVDALGRVAGEDDFAAGRGVQETLHLRAGGVVRRGRLLAEYVHTAVDVGVAVRVVAGEGVQHRARFLGRGGAVEIDQRPAAHQAVQNRKVVPDPLDVEGRGRRLSRAAHRSHPHPPRQPVAKGQLHSTGHASRLNCVVPRSHIIEYAHSSRLVSRAPDRSRCDAGLSPRAVEGAAGRAGKLSQQQVVELRADRLDRNPVQQVAGKGVDQHAARLLQPQPARA